MVNEALTVKGQSLFLYQKSTHWSFSFVFGMQILKEKLKSNAKNTVTEIKVSKIWQAIFNNQRLSCFF